MTLATTDEMVAAAESTEATPLTAMSIPKPQHPIPETSNVDSIATATEMARLIQAHYANEDDESAVATTDALPTMTETRGVAVTTTSTTEAVSTNDFPTSPIAIAISRNHGMSDEEKLKAQSDISAWNGHSSRDPMSPSQEAAGDDLGSPFGVVAGWLGARYRNFI